MDENAANACRRPTLGLALVLCALASAIGAQERQTPQGPPSATFQVDVDYVDVDVLVTDERGNFVSDLAANEFEVFEDGKPVKVDTFSIVDIPVDQRRVSFGGRDVRQDVHTNRSTLEGRFYVIVLDDIGTSALRSPHVIRAARQFVDEHLAANDTAAVVYTSGRRDRAQDFTSDRTLLVASIAKFMGTKLRSSTLDRLDGYYQDRALAEGLAAGTGDPVDTTSAAVRSQSPFSRGEGYANRTYDINDIERGQRALGVLGQLKNYAEFLANVRGRRKAMVLFSEGIDYPVHDIFGAHDASAVLNAMEDAISAAARANVNIFAVDPRGLVGLTSEYIELNQSNADLYNIGARDPRYGMQPSTALLAEMRQTQDSLRTLAEETGGQAVVDVNAFKPAYERIVQANSRYYMLGYRPPTHPRDGKFHKIDVRIKRPGLRVTARKGYASPRVRARDEAARLERERIARTKGSDQTSSELRGLLDRPLQHGGIAMSVQAAPFRRTAKSASVALAIEVDPARLKFTPQQNDSVFSNRVELSLFSISEQGKPLQGLRTELDLTLRPETYARVRANGLRVNPRVELPPGRYQMRVGVREAGGGEMGTVFYALEVPDFARAPIAVSGLLLTSQSAQQVPTLQPDEAAKGILPSAATSRRVFSQSDVLTAFAEVYVNGSSKPSRLEVSTRLINESGADASTSTDILTDRVPNTNNGATTYNLTKQIPLQGIPPGRYLLRIEATDRRDLRVDPAASNPAPGVVETSITVVP